MQTLADNKLEGLKLEIGLKLSSLVEDTELKEKLNELVDYAIKEAFSYGKMAGIQSEEVEKMFSQMKDCLSEIFNPAEKKRADKYRRLYVNQRLITDCLHSALQHAEYVSIICEEDSMVKDFSAFTCLGLASCPTK